MFGAIAGGIASALAGGAMSKLFGGGQKAASGGIQGDVLATDNNTVGMGEGLQAAYANLHTDQERDYFMQRYHDVISSFGGKTSYDADNRPLLVMRSNLWASGYDVDGTDQTSLGQFSG